MKQIIQSGHELTDAGLVSRETGEVKDTVSFVVESGSYVVIVMRKMVFFIVNNMPLQTVVMVFLQKIYSFIIFCKSNMFGIFCKYTYFQQKRSRKCNVFTG